MRYSEFKALLKAGKVDDLELGKHHIAGKLGVAELDKLLPEDKLAQLKKMGNGP